MTKTFQLTEQSGTQGVELEINAFGQVRPSELVERGLARDIYHACELLDVAPAEMRYGFVHAADPFEKLFGAELALAVDQYRAAKTERKAI